MKQISKKICLLGDFGVGKTSLVRRFVYNRFEDKYISTIGVKVSQKTVIVPQGDDLVELALMLWDLAGNEEFSSIRVSYLRGSAGALLVGDLSRPATCDSLRRVADDLRNISPRAHIVIAANKRDLLVNGSASAAGNPVTQIEETALSLRSAYYLTSTLTGEGVEAAFRHLGRLLVAGEEPAS